ncbi:MAG: AIR synthase-related protein [Caldilineaceae bacterium]
MAAGDVLLGLPSSGPHTNGYSLIRRLVATRDLSAPLADGQTLADALLAPHRCYLDAVDALTAGGVAVKGLAHITGGGFVDNIPRILPAHLAAHRHRRLDRAARVPSPAGLERHGSRRGVPGLQHGDGHGGRHSGRAPGRGSLWCPKPARGRAHHAAGRCRPGGTGLSCHRFRPSHFTVTIHER